jgi:biopolymer transport protein ExbB
VGFTHFLVQTDAVGKAILAILLLMSLASWSLVTTKALSVWLERRRSGRFVSAFRDAPSIGALLSHLDKRHADEPYRRLASGALAAWRHQKDPEFLTRAMRRILGEETARLESGLTLLASVGSTAPFVGLFGTVWGVYHALVAVGVSGQGTLDKVAGPVGEALIMTGLGLAVAIPAVLAYNAFVRSNRLLLSRLDAYAHDLFALITTGGHVGEAGALVPLRPIVKGA